MSEQTIEIYKYTHLHGGWVEYSADDDKYSDERFIDVVRKEYITVSDLEFLNLPRWCASLATSQPPGEKPPNAAELFREALAWGFVYGPEIPSRQWDEMRETKVAQLVTRLHCPTTEK